MHKIQLLATIFAEVLHEAQEIPNGHFYAMVMSKCTFAEYTAALDVLKRAGLISEFMHVLKWIGPQIPKEKA